MASSCALLARGIPQGSTLGPVSIYLYMFPLGYMIRQYGCVFWHCSADVTQLCLSVDSLSCLSQDAIAQLQLLPKSSATR